MWPYTDNGRDPNTSRRLHLIDPPNEAYTRNIRQFVFVIRPDNLHTANVGIISKCH